MQVRLFLAAFLALPATAALADPWLFMHPGLVVADHQEDWQARCNHFKINSTAAGESFVSCILPNGDVLTAKSSPDGILWWGRFWGAVGLDRAAFLDHFRTELGFSGPPEPCPEVQPPSECWTVGSARVLSEIAISGDKWEIIVEDRSFLSPG
jgi:hypothetical protein